MKCVEKVLGLWMSAKDRVGKSGRIRPARRSEMKFGKVRFESLLAGLLVIGSSRG